MIRLLGILIGASIATGILIVIVGIPQLPETIDREDDRAVLEPPVELPPAETLPPDPQPVEADEPVPASPVADEPVPAAPVADEPVPAAPVADEPVMQPPVAATSDREQVVQSESAADGEADNWYAFWSPFRSEFAARGFMSQLQKTTGLDYRVVKQDAGVYEVAFAYTDDADVLQKLALIESATGLELSGS